MMVMARAKVSASVSAPANNNLFRPMSSKNGPDCVETRYLIAWNRDPDWPSAFWPSFTFGAATAPDSGFHAGLCGCFGHN